MDEPIGVFISGVPSTLVTTAVYARGLSAIKDLRVCASKVLNGPKQGDNPDFASAVSQLIGKREHFIQADDRPCMH